MTANIEREKMEMTEEGKISESSYFNNNKKVTCRHLPAQS